MQTSLELALGLGRSDEFSTCSLLGTHETDLNVRVNDEDRELLHQCLAQAALILERLHESRLIEKIIAQTAGDATDEVDTTVGHDLERQISSLVAIVLRHLLNDLHKKRIVRAETPSNNVLRSDVINGNSWSVLIFNFKNPIKLGVLRLHELVDERDARASDQTLNAQTVRLSLALQVLFVVRSLEVLESELLQLEVFLRDDVEVDVAALGRVGLEKLALISSHKNTFTEASAWSNHNLDLSAFVHLIVLGSIIERLIVLFPQAGDTVAGTHEVVEELEALQAELFPDFFTFLITPAGNVSRVNGVITDWAGNANDTGQRHLVLADALEQLPNAVEAGFGLL